MKTKIGYPHYFDPKDHEFEVRLDLSQKIWYRGHKMRLLEAVHDLNDYA